MSETNKKTKSGSGKPRAKNPAQANQVKPNDFLEMAKTYRVENNPLILSAIDTYILQLKVIDSIRRECDEGVTVSKEYVKGRENLYVSPAVRELPRHVDSANKTAATIKDLIKEFGAITPTSKDEFEEF